MSRPEVFLSVMVGVSGLLATGLYLNIGKLSSAFRHTALVSYSEASVLGLACSSLRPLEARSNPLMHVDPEIWGFARAAGIEINVCEPSLLKFQASRPSVDNVPSAWGVFSSQSLLATGEVAGDEETFSVEIATPGRVVLAFINADPFQIENRRTIYFKDVHIVPIDKDVIP